MYSERDAANFIRNEEVSTRIYAEVLMNNHVRSLILTALIMVFAVFSALNDLFDLIRVYPVIL